MDKEHVRATYDRVAADYAGTFFDELAGKSFDRALLDRFAAGQRGAGPVWDVGCGPGHVARYLRERGVAACGLDLSAGMLGEARRRNPQLPFVQGTMGALPVADGVLAAIVSFYALIHIPRPEVPAVLREFRRAVRPGGDLLLAVHGGEGEIRTDNWFGREVSIGATLFGADELGVLLGAAGFAVVSREERPPYEHEYPSRRLYFRARTPR
jgi:SAM-dependent methyltransferase